VEENSCNGNTSIPPIIEALIRVAAGNKQVGVRLDKE
jgi:hypothetical protein